MIIDFRLRPPAKGWEPMNLHGPDKNVHNPPVNGIGTWPVPSSDEWSMPLLFKEMDEAGITKAVVMGRNNPSFGHVSNDDVIAVCKEYPDKFIPFGSIAITPTCSIRDAVKEIERAVGMGCKGICIEPGACIPALFPDGRQMYPIYDACVQLGVIICMTLSHKLAPDISYLDPARVQRACHDFPTGKFVITHAFYPYIQGAIAACTATKNLWISPDTYMHSPNMPGHAQYAEGLIYAQGVRFLFSSAYPFRNLKQQVEEVKAYNFPQKYYDRYMYENAVELLGL